VVTIMLTRVALLKVSLYMMRGIIMTVTKPMTRLTKAIRSKIDEINAQQVVFFTHGDDIAHINNVMLYLRKNEHTNRLKLVTVLSEDDSVPRKVQQEVKILDRAYPDIDIEFVERHGTFGPQMIRRLSKEWGIPLNLMFIGSPTGNLGYSLAELGGVRLII